MENKKYEWLHEKAKNYDVKSMQQMKIDIMRNRASEMFYTLDFLIEDSREKSLAVTKMEECLMWAVKAISRQPGESDEYSFEKELNESIKEDIKNTEEIRTILNPADLKAKIAFVPLDAGVTTIKAVNMVSETDITDSIDRGETDEKN